MAVNKQVETVSLSIEVQNGLDKAGDPTYSKKTFSNVRIGASAEVNSLMDLIIAKNVFFASSGALVKKAGAQLTQRSVTKYDLA